MAVCVVYNHRVNAVRGKIKIESDNEYVNILYVTQILCSISALLW